MSELEMVLRQRIRSVKVYPDQHTKKTQTVSQLKNASIQQIMEKVPSLTKWNSLFLTKSSLFQLKKDGGVRPVGDLTVVALRSYWSQVRPIKDDIPEVVWVFN